MILYLMNNLPCKNVSILNNFGAGALFSQSLGVDILPPPDPKPPRVEFNYSVGFKDLNGKHRFFS